MSKMFTIAGWNCRVIVCPGSPWTRQRLVELEDVSQHPPPEEEGENSEHAQEEELGIVFANYKEPLLWEVDVEEEVGPEGTKPLISLLLMILDLLQNLEQRL